jgi:hypothetical protein
VIGSPRSADWRDASSLKISPSPTVADCLMCEPVELTCCQVILQLLGPVRSVDRQEQSQFRARNWARLAGGSCCTAASISSRVLIGPRELACKARAWQMPDRPNAKWTYPFDTNLRATLPYIHAGIHDGRLPKPLRHRLSGFGVAGGSLEQVLSRSGAPA